MSTLRLLVPTCLLLAACVVEPPPPALTGSWGGIGVKVDATPYRAHFEFACAQGETGALRFTAPSRGAATGSFLTVSGDSPQTDPLWVEAQESGDTLVTTYYVAVHDSAHSFTYSVRRNQPADFDARICPQ